MTDSVLDQLLPPCDVLVDRDTHGARVPLAQRVGIMLHFDDSSSDAGALAWFRDPAFRLSYNRAYRDDGTRIRITPSIHHAAYHAGICLVEPGLPVGTTAGGFKYGGANTGYFGLAVTCNTRDTVTDAQFDALTADIAMICRICAWGPADVERRVVGHHEKAIFNPRDNPSRPKSWGKIGRKIDPVGDPTRPVLDMNRTREAVRWLLSDLAAPVWSRWPA